ncbi:MAG: hypothetical protein KAX16_00550, partial [Actinomycetia bacterium]|nr:hypothetical protein [Actinomycetes bacterium]
MVSGLLTGKIQIENLDDTDNVEVCLKDEDGDKMVSLGKLEGGTDSMLTGDLSAQVENLEDFDSVCVTRGPAEDGNVLFTADLPHDGDGGQTPGGSSQPDSDGMEPDSDGMEPHDETPPSDGGSPDDRFPQDEHSPNSQSER